ncbi:hypothetical protein CF327_g5261 [Tilletia walkeri]|nr:hypothetical protein CF327_g5261 [Tilletia walkeri]
MASSSTFSTGPTNADQKDNLTSLLPRLQHALHRIATTRPRTIASPPTQPRRASVAILVRVKPAPQDEGWLAAEFEAALNQADSTNGSGSEVEAETDESSAPAVPSSTTTTTTQSIISDLEQSAENISASELLGASSTSQPAPDASLVHLSQASLGPPPPSTSIQPTPASAATSITAIQQQPRTPPPVPSQLESFFAKPWVQRGTPELLYIKRASRTGDNWSAHVAFPGGRAEPSDENGLYTAMRETWEEVGVDLAEPEFVSIGQLDDREITTSLGKRLLMVLSPYVFLQTSPFSPLPDLQPSEVSSAHWIPLQLLYTPKPRWGLTSVDIASRLAPKSPAVRWVLRALVGKMDFRCVLLPNKPIATANQEGELEEYGNENYPPGERYPSPPPVMSNFLIGSDAPKSSKTELRLWGLTLGMTLDLLSHMSTLLVPGEGPPTSTDTSFLSAPGLAPLLQSYTSAPASAGIGIHALPGTSSTSTTTNAADPLSSAISAPQPPATTRMVATLRSAVEQLRADPRGTSSDWLARMKDELHLTPPPHARALAPSMTSVFPRFSYPDVNFWIWVFGYRYRKIVRAWERGLGTGMERRVNWSGMALGAFYSAVRRALIVAILLRALSMASVITGISWLASRRMRRRRKGLPGLGLDELMPSLFADD